MKSLIFFSILVCFCIHGVTTDNGWFGSHNQYKCHCLEEKCDAFGNCNGACVRGWFGPACQFLDLATQAENISPNLQELVDGQNTTCNITKMVTIKLNNDYVISWIRVVTAESSPQFDVKFKDSSSSEFSVTCETKIVYKISDTVTDVTCSGLTLLRYIQLDFHEPTNVCSLHVSGGRNVALRQKTDQSSTYVEANVSYNSSLAVDGNTNNSFYEAKSCAHAGIYVPAWWRLDFDKPKNVFKFIIYNRDVFQLRLKGFNLTTYGPDGSIKYQYIDRNPSDSVPIYYVNNDMLTNPVSIVIVNGVDILTLCEVKIYGEDNCVGNAYGLECSKSCNCYHSNDICYVNTGACSAGCALGYAGEDCQEPYALSLDVTPSTVVTGLTGQMEVNCSTSLAMSSIKASLISLIISRSSTNQSSFTELASINVFTSDSQVMLDVSDVTASGKIDNNGLSYIKLNWEFPDSNISGIYRCDANGVDHVGHPMNIHTSKTTYVVKPDIYALVQNIQNLIKSVDSIYAMLDEQKLNITNQLEKVNVIENDLTVKDNLWNTRLDVVENLFLNTSSLFV